MGFVSELRRRNVFRMAVLYIVTAWLIVQVAGVLIDLAQLPDWIGTTTLWLLAIGFPLALIFSWFYEITPEGISLEKTIDPEVSITHVTGRRLDFVVIALLSAAVILFAYDKWWLSPPPATSIAVLPFDNISADLSQEYFSDGISEELLSLLAQVPELTVISRSSAFSFKGKNVDVRTIARELHVAHILDGSVRKVGDRVRVVAQLVDTSVGKIVWSQTYDRSLGDIFAVQDEIAKSVVSEMRIALLGDVPNLTRTDVEAYSLFLQAQHVARQGSPEAYSDAILLLRRVLSIDESYAPAWTALSFVISNQVNNGLRNVAEGIEEARIAAAKALEIDPELASAHIEMARIAMNIDHDYSSAISHLRAVRTRDSRFFHRAANLALILRRYHLAVEWGQQAILLDPVSPYAHMSLGTSYLADGQFAEAEQALQRALMLSPFAINALMNLAILRLAQGEPEAALQIVEEVDVEEAYLYIGSMAMFAKGDVQRSDELLNRYIQNFADQSASGIATVYAFRKQADLAFHWLDRAYEAGDNALSSILVNPPFRNLDDHPRMQPFLRQIGLSDEQRAEFKLDLALSN
jgi:TolB-like protein